MSTNIKTIKFIPGEHGAGLDNAQAYREFFGDPHYAFDLKGVHFVALDNVSTPDGSLGDARLQIIIFAHRPLMDVYPKWGWQTKDEAKALRSSSPSGE